MNRRTYISTAVVGTSVLSGCLSWLPLIGSDRPDRPLPDVPTGSWTQHGADGANTFAPNVSAPSRGNLAWTSEAYTRWQPTVSDGTVYITNFDFSNEGNENNEGRVIALDAQDGTELWRTTLGASEPGEAVVVDDRCIVEYDAELVALDSRSGDRVWTELMNSSSLDPLVADEDTGTVLGTTDAGIEAFRASNGEKRWEVDTVDQLVRAPAIYDGRVFVVGHVDETPSLAALSLADGSEHWRKELTATPESAAPVATKEGVFVSDDETLVVHDRETGDRLRELYTFSYDGGKYDIRTVAVDDGTVFVTSDGDDAVALDSETGTERWRRDDSVERPGICVGTETVVFPMDGPEFAPEESTISAFDRETGEMRWYYGFDPGFHNMVTSPPVLIDGAVFFTANTFDGVGALGDVPELEN